MTWIAPPQTFLGHEAMLNNAQLVANYFEGTDWTKEAISAMLGNMQTESSINPNMREFRSIYNQGWGEGDLGFGLVQWTPARKLMAWASARGLNYKDGDTQLARIHYETEENIQWIANRLGVAYGAPSRYDFSFAQFRRNDLGLSVEELAKAFLWNYEAPNYNLGIQSEETRAVQARNWYNLISFEETSDPKPPPTPEPNPEYLPTSPSDPSEEVEKGFINKISSSIVYQHGQTELYSNKYINLQKLGNNAYIVNTVKGYVEDEKDKYKNPPPSEEIEEPLPPNEDAEIIGGDKTKPTRPVLESETGISETFQSYMTPWGAHAGVDFYTLDGSVGTAKVFAVRDGVVNFVHSGCSSQIGNNLGNSCGGYFGNNIRIRHTNDSYHSLYSHLHNVYVSLGETVKQGQVIATIGNSGNSTGAHCHFEISKSGAFGSSNIGANGVVDPLAYLRGDI